MCLVGINLVAICIYVLCFISYYIYTIYIYIDIYLFS